MHGYFSGASIAMAIVMVAFAALIVVAIVWAVRSQGPREAPPEISARELLDRRLARNEISVEKYDELRAVVDGGLTHQLQ
jgi:uncharacterized membrane protein